MKRIEKLEEIPTEIYTYEEFADDTNARCRCRYEFQFLRPALAYECLLCGGRVISRFSEIPNSPFIHDVNVRDCIYAIRATRRTQITYL